MRKHLSQNFFPYSVVSNTSLSTFVFALTFKNGYQCWITIRRLCFVQATEPSPTQPCKQLLSLSPVLHLCLIWSNPSLSLCHSSQRFDQQCFNWWISHHFHNLNCSAIPETLETDLISITSSIYLWCVPYPAKHAFSFAEV